jgi:hypothetical protein
MSRVSSWFVGGLFSCIGLFLGAFPVSADDAVDTVPRSVPSQVIVNVNLSDAKVLSQEARSIRVGFSLTNQDAKTQALGIRFGFELVETAKTGQVVADTFVFPETIDLAPGQSVKKEAEYTVPDALTGDFSVWVIARNAGGLILGLGNAGKVTFTPQSETVGIKTESCALKVVGDAKVYDLLQGVDVTPNETLILSCQVENRSAATQTLIPSFDTKRRSQYGDPMTVPSVPVSKISLAASEKKVIDIVIPKASSPQAYDVRVVLRNESNPDMASNAINAHYVVRGVSATIQNISFGKSSYRTGEPVDATLFWSSSADQFLGSRVGSGTKIEQVTVALGIRNENGAVCIEPLVRTVDGEGSDTLTLSATAIADCVHPTATVTITDSTGTVLDTRVVTLAQPVPDTQPSQSAQTFDENGLVGDGMRTALVAIGIVLFLAASVLIILKRRARMAGIIKGFIFFALLSTGFLSGGGTAEAVSWSEDGFNEEYCSSHLSETGYSSVEDCVEVYHLILMVRGGFSTATVNSNKSTYLPGESITLYSTVSSFLCANAGLRSYALSALLEGNRVFLQSGSISGETAIYGENSSFVAPSVPGRYRMTLSFTGTGGYTADAFIDITVDCVASSGLSCTSAANNCGSTNSGTISCGGACSAAAPANEVIGGSCTSAANNCGSTNSGTISCGGACSAAAPADIALGTACSGPVNACGMTIAGTIGCSGCSSTVAPANTLCDLAVCKNGCTSTIDRSGSFSIASGSPSTTLRACFYQAGTSACASGVDVTGSATWTETNAPKNAISFSSTGILNTRFVNGDEVFRVSYGGVTKSPRVTVTCIPNTCSIPDAKAKTDTYCPETVQDTGIATGCDGETLTCPGTRHCDYNVKEVSP